MKSGALRKKDVILIAGPSALARLGAGMITLSIILIGHGAGLPLRVTGSMASAYAIGVAAGLPVSGFLLSRFGPRRTLLTTSVLFAICSTVLVVITGLESQIPILALTSAATGLLTPPTTAAVRTAWSRAARVSDAKAAYALEATLTDAGAILGPMIVAPIVQVTSGIIGFLTAVVVAIAGAVSFAHSSSSPEHDEPSSRSVHDPARRLTVPRPILFVVISGGLVSTLYGSVPVLAASAAGRVHALYLTGVVLAAWSAFGVVGGIWYGFLRTAQSVRRQYVSVIVLLLCILTPLLITTSPLLIVAAVMASGLVLAPMEAMEFQIISSAGGGPIGFTLLQAASYCGFALGSGVAASNVEADAGSAFRATWLLLAPAGLAALALLRQRAS